MLGLTGIMAMSRKAGLESAKKNKHPFVIEDQDRERNFMNYPQYGRRFPFCKFPNLGDYVPEGWKLDSYFQMDKTGQGDGFSLGIDESKPKLIVGHGYAIIEEGEFQVVIGDFIRVNNK